MRWRLPLAIVAALLLALPAFAGMRARYGGELRVLVPEIPSRIDPSTLASPHALTLTALSFEPLFELDASGALVPALAAHAPEPERGGRRFRIRLRHGLRSHDGETVSAKDVVASLSRLATPGSPYAAALLPIAGGLEAVERGGRVAGLSAPNRNELRVELAFPYPDWPRALAHPGTAVALRRGGELIGTGPFVRGERGEHATAFDDCPSGRPWADALRLLKGDARVASRSLSLGEVDVSTAGGEGGQLVEGPALFATYAAVNQRDLGASGVRLRRALAAVVDSAELARYFVRGGSLPMYGLLPPALDASSGQAGPRLEAADVRGVSASLLVDASSEDQVRVAERLQIKLHDRGAAISLRRLATPAYRKALSDGDYELAIVSFAALPEPGLALAQLVAFAAGGEQARDELRRIGAGATPEARSAAALKRAEELRGELPLLPLYAESVRLTVAPRLPAPRFGAGGVPALADLWWEQLPTRPAEAQPVVEPRR